MFHSKSKSNKIKEKEEEKVSYPVSEKSFRLKKTNSVNFSSMDSTKENINLKLITNGKISNLLYDSENDDKIVNISKLEEDSYPYPDDRRNQYDNKYIIEGSDLDVVIGNINENDNTKPIINISNLESPINYQNDLKNINIISTKDNSLNKLDNSMNSNIIDGQKNDTENSSNITINKIKKENIVTDEPFKTKRKSCVKRTFHLFLKIIFLMKIFIIFAFFIFCIIKMLINNKH